MGVRNIFQPLSVLLAFRRTLSPPYRSINSHCTSRCRSCCDRFLISICDMLLFSFCCAIEMQIAMIGLSGALSRPASSHRSKSNSRAHFRTFPFLPKCVARIMTIYIIIGVLTFAFYHFSNRQFLFLSLFSCRMKIHKNGNASEVLKSISSLDNSNKQC